MTNLNPEQVNQAKNLLENSRTILMALPLNPTIDEVAGALSLYLSLSAVGKQVMIASPTEMTVAYNHLIGVDKIATNVNSTSGRNLIISFPYQEGSIEKVSYNIENNAFNLVIEPRNGYPSINPEMINYGASNGNYDCLVTIGCNDPSELGQIYINNQKLFNEKPIINIDASNNNSNFGKFNLVDATISSICELLLRLMDQMGLVIEPDMATNFLIGLIAETNNFSSQKTSATTFETAAQLMKYGAKKPQAGMSPSDKTPYQVGAFKSTGPFGKGQRAPSFFRPKPATPPQQHPQQQVQSFMRQRPQHPQQPPTREAGKPAETPPDWLKPKIYKGSTLL